NFSVAAGSSASRARTIISRLIPVALRPGSVSRTVADLPASSSSHLGGSPAARPRPVESGTPTTIGDQATGKPGRGSCLSAVEAVTDHSDESGIHTSGLRVMTWEPPVPD